jgi:hypothetical protein
MVSPSRRVAEQTTTAVCRRGYSCAKNGEDKLNPVVRLCYDRLRSSEGVLFVFGHSASQSDWHIYDALAQSRIRQIFFCVHEPDRNLEGIRERLAPLAVRVRDMQINYVEAASADVWGKPV